MDKVKNAVLSARITAEFFRYGVASVFSYSFLVIGTYVLTDIFGIKANISYLIIVSIAYVWLYFVSSGYVFRSVKTLYNTHRFLWHIAIFWFLNNLFFNLLFAGTDIHYILITLINIAVFAPLRFLSLRYFVFQAHKENS